MSTNSVKPLELVVSAIHCLREKRGSSPQKILRYLAGRYNVGTEILKPYIKTGLKRGVSFGLITLQSGLYRLNDILSAPLDSPRSNTEITYRTKFCKPCGVVKKGRVKQISGRKRRRAFKTAPSLSTRYKRKATSRREKKKRVGFTTRRSYNEKRRKSRKRQKSKGKRRVRQKGEKSKKSNKLEVQQLKQEDSENKNTENEKGDTSKSNVKT